MGHQASYRGEGDLAIPLAWIIVIVLVCLIILAVIGFLLWRYFLKRRGTEGKYRPAKRELEQPRPPFTISSPNPERVI